MERRPAISIPPGKQLEIQKCRGINENLFIWGSSVDSASNLISQGDSNAAHV
jgi:hypothetical protein